MRDQTHRALAVLILACMAIPLAIQVMLHRLAWSLVGTGITATHLAWNTILVPRVDEVGTSGYLNVHFLHAGAFISRHRVCGCNTPVCRSILDTQ